MLHSSCNKSPIISPAPRRCVSPGDGYRTCYRLAGPLPVFTDCPPNKKKPPEGGFFISLVGCVVSAYSTG